MDLSQVRCFVELISSGSIAAAARRLNYSAPAVHKQLKQLETELGIRLYERAGRVLRPTQAADILLPYARDLLAQHDAALAAITEWKGLKHGLVRIGAGPTIATYILPGLLRAFRSAHPKIDLYVETGNTRVLTESLVNGSLDLALLVAPDSGEEPFLSVQAGWEVEFVLVSNLQAAPRRCSLAELRKFPFILYQKGSRIELLIERYFAEAGFQPKVIMRFDNAEAIKAMIRNRLGVSMLPMWIVDSELKRGTLSVIRQREHPLRTQVELACQKTTYRPQPVQAFIEIARKFRFRTPRLIYG